MPIVGKDECVGTSTKEAMDKNYEKTICSPRSRVQMWLWTRSRVQMWLWTIKTSSLKKAIKILKSF